jgi:hypothetical protein
MPRSERRLVAPLVAMTMLVCLAVHAGESPQISDVAPLLTAAQLTVYEQIQRERVAQQRSFQQKIERLNK